VGSKVFCGIDWAERQHDVAVVDEQGKLIAKRRISDGLAGFTELVELRPPPGTTRRIRSRSPSGAAAGQ
jgi:Transposase